MKLKKKSIEDSTLVSIRGLMIKLGAKLFKLNNKY